MSFRLINHSSWYTIRHLFYLPLQNSFVPLQDLHGYTERQVPSQDLYRYTERQVPSQDLNSYSERQVPSQDLCLPRTYGCLTQGLFGASPEDFLVACIRTFGCLHQDFWCLHQDFLK